MSTQDPIFDIGLTQRKKVLVAEDEPNIASLIEDWLSDSYEVIVCYNGTSALQKAKWHKPQVVLMDLVMPDMGGYEVVRALQADAETNRIPVIAMTAKNYDDSTVRMIKSERNVLGFINKPFRPDDLRRQIQMVMAGQRTFTPVAAPLQEEAPPAPPLPPPQAAPPPPPPPPSPPVVYPTFPTEAPPETEDPLPSIVPTAAEEPPLPPPVSPPSRSPQPVDFTTGPVLSPEPPRRPAPPPRAVPPPPPAPPSRSAPGTLSAGEELAGVAQASARLRPAAFPPPRPKPVQSGTSPRPVVEEDDGGGLGGSILRWTLGAAVKSLILLLAVAAASEKVARWSEAARGGRPFLPPLRFSRLAALPYEFPSGASWEQNGVSYSLNAWRLRDREISLLPGAESFRVLVLGGTGLFGEGLPVERCAARRLETLLNEAQPFKTKGKYEVINAALWGYSPEEQWAFYESAVAELKPHALLWVCETKSRSAPTSAGLRGLARRPSLTSGFFSKTALFRLYAAKRLRAGEDGPAQDVAALRRRAEGIALAKGMVLVFAPLQDGETGGRRPPVAPEDLVSPAGHRLLAEWLFNRLVDESKGVPQ